MVYILANSSAVEHRPQIRPARQSSIRAFLHAGPFWHCFHLLIRSHSFRNLSLHRISSLDYTSSRPAHASSCRASSGNTTNCEYRPYCLIIGDNTLVTITELPKPPLEERYCATTSCALKRTMQSTVNRSSAMPRSPSRTSTVLEDI